MMSTDHLTLTDLDTGATAKIAGKFGFNCYSFMAKLDALSIDVIAAQPEFISDGSHPSRSGIPLLFPFPNRIAHGRFTWKERDYHLPEKLVGYSGNHAIHGFCLDRPWRVIEQTKNSATAAFQLSIDAPERRGCWPADFVIEARYEVLGPALRCDIRVHNPDSVPLPFGWGAHPYVRVPLVADSRFEQCFVEAPASQWYELVDAIPAGPAEPVPPEHDLREGLLLDGVTLDDAYTGLSYEKGRLVTRVLDARAGVQIVQTADENIRHLVAFTPPWTNAVCLEPYTCAINAINRHDDDDEAGLLVLEPGESWRTWFELRVGRITA